MKNRETLSHEQVRVTIIFAVIVLILSIPLIAMQFTNAVKWTLSDFVTAGALLLSAGFVIEIVSRKVKTAKVRLVLFFIILLFLLLVWAELAVGIFDSPMAGH